ncbi:MAG TPA: TonB-dependent receptor [Oligoflexus sp.]|uniref:TonB-dependent receptor domain-containing protein n=1 Tax=Oligoflexus sp. TaxID=1971216 RepID=UPI002D236E9C|nr:TonB-dependent receptor [Oligoflexus sp.]HYX38316.1 TonB-dependent receptor [Oligoflexus sp.]
MIPSLFETRCSVLAKSPFKAPSLRNIYDGEGRFYTSVRDLRKCEEAKADNNETAIKRFCNSDNSVETVASGNKDLEAEKSENWGLGFAYEPVQGTGLSFDYWNSKILDQIENATAIDIMQLELEGRPLPKGIVIERAESVDGKLGEVIRLTNPVTNLSEVRASGIEAKAYTSVPTEFGRFGLNSDYTYTLSYKSKPLPTAGYKELIDENPRWRWNNTFLYSLANVDYSLTISRSANTGRK